MMDINDRLCTAALDAAVQGLCADPCVFCDIAAAPQRHRAVEEWEDAVAIVPLNPKADGHVMVIPKRHVVHAAIDPAVFARCAHLAAEIAEPYPSYNIITSAGAAATQSVMHLHVHVVPRREGDGIALAGGPGWPRCACGNALDSRLDIRYHGQLCGVGVSAQPVVFLGFLRKEHHRCRGSLLQWGRAGATNLHTGA